MNRFAAFATALVLATVSGLALADGADKPACKHGDAKFPATATEFRAKVQAREARGRARVEQHIAKAQLPAAEADRIRATFEAGAAKVRAKLDAVCADGTVTKEEAHELRAVAREAMPRHGKHRRGGDAPARRGA